MTTLGSLALAGLVLLASGCGGEKAANVDLNAQLTALSGDSDAKINALAEISKLGAAAASAVPKITPLLKDEDDVVRRTAAFTLGAIGPAAKSAVPDLKEMLKTTDRDQLTAVGNALQAIDPKAVDGLKIQNVSN
ncbi:MAG: HEAT repeat domain-containing protein [Verrucomicrobiales bacterium]|nr:HEAT repeat domain-containing protein [Verrucomicrobiales bacterium]